MMNVQLMPIVVYLIFQQFILKLTHAYNPRTLFQNQIQQQQIIKQERRQFFTNAVASAVPWFLLDPKPTMAAEEKNLVTHPFHYSNEWSGTNLPLLSLEDAAVLSTTTTTNSNSNNNDILSLSSSPWKMGKWPDPILRHSADPIDISKIQNNDSDKSYFEMVQLASQRLMVTARQNKAVGLAAQQCGINARLLFVERPKPTIMINPEIIQRSSENQLQVWSEECLVLPPTFIATVLRDYWVDVQYYYTSTDLLSSSKFSFSNNNNNNNMVLKQTCQRFYGEPARCIQHELDHDRGILTLDHVGFEEMENEIMRKIEYPGHYKRQDIAYSRQVAKAWV